MNYAYDPYKILGITPGNSLKEIKDAYIRLAFQYHPDRNPTDPAAHEKMEELNSAFVMVSSYTKQKTYETSPVYSTVAPKFKTGVKVKVSTRSNTPYRDHTGVVDKEPIRDTFRFWYMVRFEVNGVATISRLAEEQLVEVDNC